MTRNSSESKSKDDFLASSIVPDQENDVAMSNKTSNKPDAEKLLQSQSSGDDIVGIRLLLIHISICLCTLLVGLDFTILATAIPVITTTFNSIEDVGWYGAAFYLTLCATQPLAGKIYTLFSKKTVYLIYVGIFEIGSLVCALSPNSDALIVGRAIAGIGASGLLGGGLVIITTIVPLDRRAIWQGSWSCVFSISTIVGPLLGGAFTEHVNWRWCFYINLPIGGFATAFFFLTFRSNDELGDRQPFLHRLKSLDFFGSTLFAASIIMLLLALQWGGVSFSWDSATIIGLFVGSSIVAALFVSWSLYWGEKGLIPPRLFANRNAGLICSAVFFVNGPFQTIVYWLPIWFQAVLGVSPVGSSVRYLPTVISDVLAAFISAGIVTSTGRWNLFLLLGIVTMSVGGGMLTTLYPGISFGHIIGYQILVGVGYALVTNMAHLGMQASLSEELVPIGATSVLTVISTSCAVFLAVGQTIFQDRLQANLPASFPSELRTQLENTGAIDLRSSFDSGQLLTIISAYSESITEVWYLVAAAPVIALVLVCGCRWTSLKKDKADASTSIE